MPPQIQSDMTIFNIYYDGNGTPILQPTVIREVFWQSDYAAHMRDKGVVTADKVSVIIPRGTNAQGRTYISAEGFMSLPNDQKASYWTLSKSDKIINRIVTLLVLKITDLEKLYGRDNVLTVTDIRLNLFGSLSMQHYKVIGK
ncbi:hypothetical protein AGMMS49975_17000 [Clostridia bacterium]|nr:hypothetical protein AGMMS49975_17000 [Clostridia bacterium]